MTSNDEITVRCIRCGHTWLVDVRKLGTPDTILYKGATQRLRVETYRLVCPLDGTVNMLEVEFEEPGNGR